MAVIKGLLLFALVNAIVGKSVPRSSGSHDGVLFQGDMLMEQSEVDVANRGGDVDSVGQSNTYGSRSGNRWKWQHGIVPYDLTDLEDGFMKIFGGKGHTEKSVLNAMAEIESKTCIRFVKRTTEKDYIKFIDGGSGKCYSWVGHRGGAQEISIGFGCFYMGIAIHEIMHALGFHHEQSRPDRDHYVNIKVENVKTEYLKNFKRYSHHYIDSLGSPYDYGSIMHYPWNAGAKWPWLVTIEPKQKGAVIGQSGDYMSVLDVIQINRYYNCPRQG